MVNGKCIVHAEFYTTDRRGRVSARFDEYGFSENQPLNNSEQKESAFKDAISNASQKYAYHSNQKYDDLEFNYTLLDTEFVYIPEHKKDFYRVSYDEISPKKKRVLHKEVIDKHRLTMEQNKGQRDTSDVTISREEYDRMFAEYSKKKKSK